MATHHETQLNGALSTLAMSAVLALAGAGSPASLAQTNTLHPPASGLKTVPRTGLDVGNAPPSALAAPVAAPVAGAIGQIDQVPAVGATAGRLGTNAAVAKNYVLKAQVVPGAALSATQKLATAMAALSELAQQAKEQQDKETEEKIAQMKKTLNIGNSATLSLLNPKSPIGNASLSLGMANSVDFDKNQVAFSPDSLKKYGNLIGWPAAYCSFKTPDDGFYMVAFTVENLPNVGGTTTVTAGIKHVGIWNSENEAKATLNKGLSVVAVVQEFRKGADVSARITSDNIFAFNSCEISRIK